MPWQLQLGLHRGLSLLSISASQTRDRPLASCLPSEQLLLSEPSTSVDSHQMHYPSWQPHSWTHQTQQLPSSNSPVVSKCPLGHWADLHYLCFPDGLGALRELISTLAVPVEGAEIKTKSFFIQSQQINWQKGQRHNLDSVMSLCSKAILLNPAERGFKGAYDS